MGRDPFRIDHGFIGGNIQMQVLFVHASEGAQGGPACGSRSFAGVAVDLADSIVIIITCPLPSAMTHRGMGRMAAVITLPCIRVQDRVLPRDIPGDQVSACAPVRVITYPEALLARLARDHANNGGAIIGIRAVPLALIRAPAWWICGVAMGCALFPLRSGRVPPPQRRCRSSRRSARLCSG
jgi:hypothetical protein